MRKKERERAREREREGGRKKASKKERAGHSKWDLQIVVHLKWRSLVVCELYASEKVDWNLMMLLYNRKFDD